MIHCGTKGEGVGRRATEENEIGLMVSTLLLSTLIYYSISLLAAEGHRTRESVCVCDWERFYL